MRGLRLRRTRLSQLIGPPVFEGKTRSSSRHSPEYLSLCSACRLRWVCRVSTTLTLVSLVSTARHAPVICEAKACTAKRVHHPFLRKDKETSSPLSSRAAKLPRAAAAFRRVPHSTAGSVHRLLLTPLGSPCRLRVAAS